VRTCSGVSWREPWKSGFSWRFRSPLTIPANVSFLPFSGFFCWSLLSIRWRNLLWSRFFWACLCLVASSCSNMGKSGIYSAANNTFCVWTTSGSIQAILLLSVSSIPKRPSPSHLVTSPSPRPHTHVVIEFSQENQSLSDPPIGNEGYIRNRMYLPHSEHHVE
jgi:hypothetical protein